jgi:hypothetical protein
VALQIQYQIHNDFQFFVQNEKIYFLTKKLGRWPKNSKKSQKKFILFVHKGKKCFDQKKKLVLPRLAAFDLAAASFIRSRAPFVQRAPAYYAYALPGGVT